MKKSKRIRDCLARGLLALAALGLLASSGVALAAGPEPPAGGAAGEAGADDRKLG